MTLIFDSTGHIISYDEDDHGYNCICPDCKRNHPERFEDEDDGDDDEVDDGSWTECVWCGATKVWSHRRSKFICPRCDEDDNLEDEW